VPLALKYKVDRSAIIDDVDLGSISMNGLHHGEKVKYHLWRNQLHNRKTSLSFTHKRALQHVHPRRRYASSTISQILYFYVHKNLEIYRIQPSSSSLPWAMENF
jgi:hypothetical protein